MPAGGDAGLGRGANGEDAARWREVVEALDHPVVLLNARTLTMEAANRAARGDRPAGDRPCYALLHGRDRRCTPCVLQDALRSGGPVVREQTTIGNDGVRRHHEVHLHPLGDPAGRWTHAVEYWLDVTERRRAEDAQRRTGRALKALSEFNQLLVRERDERRLLEALCRVLVESAGYRLAWVGLAEADPGHAVRPVAQRGFEAGYLEAAQITWDDTERGRGPTGTAIRTGETRVIQNLLTDPAFAPWREEALRRGYASSLAIPLRAENRIVGALSVYAAEPDAFDAAELSLLAELAGDVSYGMTSLRARSERALLSAAIEQSADLAMITDATGCIAYVNAAFERVTGYARDEVLGRNPRMLRSGRQDAEYYRRMWRTITSGGEWRGRLVNRRKDGTLYTAECWTGPVRDASGRVTHFVSIQRDVTREEALAGQLEQARKMEAVGRLAGGVAHDFNNLLTVILGYGELIVARTPEGHANRPAVQEMVRAAERAAELTRRLLAFSRRQPVTTGTLDLNEVLREVVALLQRVLGEHIRLTTALDAAPVRVTGDAGQLEQIVMNLATNARDAMPLGGTLTLETQRRPGVVVLRVGDTGEGMDAETRAHLFEPFFTTKPEGQGTGLGLATVYGIVKQWGGELAVESAPGTGTTFTFTFPEAPPAGA